MKLIGLQVDVIYDLFYRCVLKQVEKMELEWSIMNNVSPKLTKSTPDPNKKSPLVEENNIIKDVRQTFFHKYLLESEMPCPL